MNYINPLIILDLPDPFSPKMIDAAFVKMEKRRLMSEFELEGTTSIDIEGREFDKDTVLKLLDELSDDQLREFHLRIFTEPGLIEFLEDASLEYFFNGGIQKLAAHSEDFLKYVGPFFAQSYNHRLLNAYKHKDDEEIEAMCKYPLPLPAIHKALCYQDTYRSLHADVNEMEAYADGLENGNLPDGKIQDFGDEMRIESLNALPDYFKSSRDRYALALELIALSLYNDHQRVHLSVFLLRQALKLELSSDTESRVKHLLDQILEKNPLAAGLSGMADAMGGKTKKKDNVWLWIGAGTVMSFVLWMLFG
ncbi:MAG: hypothetical protein AAFY71_17610 [Bacteroidota bacterium]